MFDISLYESLIERDNSEKADYHTKNIFISGFVRSIWLQAVKAPVLWVIYHRSKREPI